MALHELIENRSKIDTSSPDERTMAGGAEVERNDAFVGDLINLTQSGELRWIVGATKSPLISLGRVAFTQSEDYILILQEIKDTFEDELNWGNEEHEYNPLLSINHLLTLFNKEGTEIGFLTDRNKNEKADYSNNSRKLGQFFEVVATQMAEFLS